MSEDVYELSITRSESKYLVWQKRNEYFPVQDQYFTQSEIIFEGKFAACIKFLNQNGVTKLTPKKETSE